MADRYIIIVDRDGLLLPIVSDYDGALATYSSYEEASRAADDTMICRAYPYSIINFDEVA